MATKKIVKKAVVGKPKAHTIKLVSYSMKAVIPTGAYANIQPEIVIKAASLEEAKAFVLPHIDELFKLYLNKSEQRNYAATEKIAPGIVLTPNRAPEGAVLTTDSKDGSTLEWQSKWFKNADLAISKCATLETLKTVSGQVDKSTNLTEEEKAILRVIMEDKKVELNKK